MTIRQRESANKFAAISPNGTERLFWIFGITIAVALGLYFRTKGLGTWPLATDEYYLYRSIAFIRDTGLPAFPCGGYYARGLLVQYLAVPLLALGLSPELALRTVAVAASVASLVAGGWLAHRLGGLRLMAIALIVLSLSAWEVEIARFGRMYAAFQALFLCYAYHAYRLFRDADTRRWRWLLPLSLLAPLVWEGGILLPITNLILIVMRQSRWRPEHLISAVVILAASLAFLTTNFRFMHEAPMPDPRAADASSRLLDRVMDIVALPIVEALPPLAGAIFATSALVVLVWVLAKARPGKPDAFAVTSILLVALAAIVGQLLLAVLLLIGAMLAGWLTLENLRQKTWLKPLIILSLIAAFWIVHALVITYTAGTFDAIKSLMSFPELLYSLLYPWLATLPLMALLVFSGTALLTVFVLLDDQPNSGLRALLAMVVLAVTIVGGAQTLYSETRYSFHLYPLLLILAAMGFTRSASWILKRRFWPGVVVPLAVLAVFFVGQDFAIRHLLTVDSYESNFRIGYSDRRARHYFPRFDFRAPAAFVNAQAREMDTVIATNVVLTEYLQSPDYIYMHRMDPRYRGQACQGGAAERWTGLPLLSQTENVAAVADRTASEIAWIIADWQALESTLSAQLIEEAWGFDKVFESPDKRISVFRRGGRKP